MRTYAVMELGIGAFALVFPLLLKAADFIFPLLVTTESHPAYSLAVRASFAFLILIVPTTCMGATLPLLTEFFHRNPRHTGSWKVGVLYATNTFGAALGIIAASYFLIELAGVSLTTLIAAFLNFVIAGIALWLAASTTSPQLRADATHASQPMDAIGIMAVAVLTATGGIALASEVLWTRALETLIGNSTYAFATIVLVYLVGIAAGSGSMSLVVNRLKRPTFWLSALTLGMGVWMIAAIQLFFVLIDSLSQYKGIRMPPGVMLQYYFIAISILTPLSFLSGACFPLATRIIDPEGEEARGSLIAKAYFWNTAGAVTGSLLAGFVVAPLFDYIESLYILALLYCATAFAAFSIVARSSHRVHFARPVIWAFGACRRSLPLRRSVKWAERVISSPASRLGTRI